MPFRAALCVPGGKMRQCASAEIGIFSAMQIAVVIAIIRLVFLFILKPLKSLDAKKRALRVSHPTSCHENSQARVISE
jgi:hypothetical protein